MVRRGLNGTSMASIAREAPDLRGVEIADVTAPVMRTGTSLYRHQARRPRRHELQAVRATACGATQLNRLPRCRAPETRSWPNPGRRGAFTASLSLGWVPRKLAIPLVPVIRGVLPGNLMEANLRRAMTIGNGD